MNFLLATSLPSSFCDKKMATGNNHKAGLRSSTLSLDEVLTIYEIDSRVGVSGKDVAARQKLYGLNELEKEEDEAMWRKFIDQFKDPLIGLLVASSVVSCSLRQYEDAISIMCAVIIVSTVAFVQEYRSEQSIAALADLVPPSCNCLRDGFIRPICASELVPGDIVTLATGDRVPADCRVLTATDLLVDESSLTGESIYMEKSADTASEEVLEQVRAELEKLDQGSVENEIKFLDPEIEAEAKRCVVFMGTMVQHGHARALVVATGMNTDFGETFEQMKSVEKRKTPLQVSMDELGQKLSLISFAVIGIIALVGVIQGENILDMFTIGVSLAVAAIPEGLPICVTVTLALGVSCSICLFLVLALSTDLFTDLI